MSRGISSANLRLSSVPVGFKSTVTTLFFKSLSLDIEPWYLKPPILSVNIRRQEGKTRPFQHGLWPFAVELFLEFNLLYAFKNGLSWFRIFLFLKKVHQQHKRGRAADEELDCEKNGGGVWRKGVSNGSIAKHSWCTANGCDIARKKHHVQTKCIGSLDQWIIKCLQLKRWPDPGGSVWC